MTTLIELEKPDVLTEVLNALKPAGRVLFCNELSAPWAISLPAGDAAYFHVIERGGGWFKLEGEKQMTPVAGGDLLIVPHGTGHVVSDSPKTKPVPLRRLIENPAESRRLMQHGGGGAQTLMTCGSFQFDNSGNNPILAVLPPLVHIHGGRGRIADWLEPMTKILADEARHSRPGSEMLIARLMDIIFVQAVRIWIETQPQDQGGWLSALRDPQIGAALGLIHREPQRNWSVSALAHEVAMSRSLFASKFNALVGAPPLTYLTRWRLWQAARLLAEKQLSVGETALHVGYESEAAFSKAFKRQFGQPPLTYRRANQPGLPT
ncbi:MAG TPA: AraC family transcriptional regulator [Blastocatellia bacterium]|nr:AraC family transcriptional regulator [Blastocatellia bacterium]HMV85824.1 AraC family transcriptional regulator [Blastocatellia bacterium]HMX26869.1 AraC family transcriptional regulator [Blastocatellia bacterium]HMY71393.1 AraC family transcriptional regulator [Blastocatellia bacterium]HMZ19530.1 AraC family transcriptional regulator [Blastocatellia bacterium]